MHIDFDSFFRNRIEGLLIRASWLGALRSLLGLDSVSQVWGGNAAWYLWIQGAPGPYHLAFSEGDVVEANGHRLFEGRFAVKCYPYPDHPNFNGFSSEERQLIRSDLFDATHTPRFEAIAKIPGSLFTVGSICLLCDEEASFVLLTYQSLDALRISQSDTLSGFSKTDSGTGAARLVRNVAGWEIGYPLFDCLVGLYAHSTGYPPAFIGATSCQGFEHTVFADGRAVCRTSRKSTQTTLTIAFHPSNDNNGRIKNLWKEGLEPGEKIQIAQRLPDTIDSTLGTNLPNNIALNPLWWTIADLEFKSELTSTCGCGQSHCHHMQENGFDEH
jgi:hypothetical protein